MLWADVTAWKSPVKCRLIFSIGTTWAYPPPAAPPFIPKHGPRDGSLSAKTAFFPILPRPRASPMEAVVFPIPVLVAVMAVTRISLHSLTLLSSIRPAGTLAMYLPYCSMLSSGMPIPAATSAILRIFTFLAISMSGFIWLWIEYRLRK